MRSTALVLTDPTGATIPMVVEKDVLLLEEKVLLLLGVNQHLDIRHVKTKKLQIS